MCIVSHKTCQRHDHFLLSKASKPLLEPIRYSTQRILANPTGSRRPGCEANYSLSLKISLKMRGAISPLFLMSYWVDDWLGIKINLYHKVYRAKCADLYCGNNCDSENSEIWEFYLCVCWNLWFFGWKCCLGCTQKVILDWSLQNIYWEIWHA